MRLIDLSFRCGTAEIWGDLGWVATRESCAFDRTSKLHSTHRTACYTQRYLLCFHYSILVTWNLFHWFIVIISFLPYSMGPLAAPS